MAYAMGGNMVKLQDSLLETERLGELFLSAKEQMVLVDKRRQETREAVTALRKQPASGKVLLVRPAGATFRLNVDRAVDILQQDQASLELELNDLRAKEKRLLGQLADKGIAPEALGPGMMQAMLNLRDTCSKPAGII